MNEITLVGRLTKSPEVNELESGKKVSDITVAVSRSYKNENGEYDTDFVRVKVWDSIADTLSKYCHKGDMIGVKGSVQTRDYEDDNGKHYVQELVANNIKFLTSNRDLLKQSNEMELM